MNCYICNGNLSELLGEEGIIGYHCPWCGAWFPCSNQKEGLLKKIQEAVKGGHKIQAIKAIRLLTGWSLKDSKDFIECFWMT